MSRVLLDTHVLLWLLSKSKRIGSHSRALIEQSTLVEVSSVTLWEIEIKRLIGKIDVPDNFHDHLKLMELQELPLLSSHVACLQRIHLPHRDPFDRMLAAQALAEGLTLVAADAKLLTLPFTYNAIK